LTGFPLAVDIRDSRRFTGATIGAFVGLVSTESSSGQCRSQGSITKTGNTHARRLLVEAAWHHAKPYRVPGKTMPDRWELARRRGSAATKATVDCIGAAGLQRKKRPAVATWPSPANSPVGHGRWPCSSSAPQAFSARHGQPSCARNDPTSNYEQP
jgi:transposase